MARHDDDAKEWGTLGAWDLTPSAISYKHQINIRTVQGEGPGPEHGRKGIQKSQHRHIRRCPRGRKKWMGKKRSNWVGKEARTGSSDCRVKGRRKRPRLLKSGDHRDV